MEKLTYKKMGTNAQKIFDECAEKFGWLKTERVNFGMMQKMFSDKAAGENYSVWFIAHSDWSGTNDDLYKNILGVTASTIKEEYLKDSVPETTDQSTRIVFAKRKNEEYYFLGLYKLLEQNSTTRIYKRISDQYPI